jgi:hypothetical protein
VLPEQDDIDRRTMRRNSDSVNSTFMHFILITTR